ncbi:hypothetical protein EYZ11_009719 [Aspergillus tanneri]|nr:hypothetical protein EYZ11_009719 [Aspergillus tanneri]
MFKHLVGRGHEEFSTMRQQDAFEFLLHIFKTINLSKHPQGLENPIKYFSFAMEQRIQCLSCKRVRYKVDEQDNVSIPVPARRLAPPNEPSVGQFAPVGFYECLDAFTAEEKVELVCPCCGSEDGFIKRSKFRSLPLQLVVNARRFELIDWVPTKLDIPVEVSEGSLDFSTYISSGQKPGEELLPDMDDYAEVFIPNEIAMDQLLGMGFPRARCEKALHMTGNSDSEAALNWLFAHLEDEDIDEPIRIGQVGSMLDSPLNAGKVAQLGEMGIEESHAKKALEATGGDIDRALDWVFSHPNNDDDRSRQPDAASSNHLRNLGFESTPANYQLRAIVCHKGSSVHAG